MYKYLEKHEEYIKGLLESGEAQDWERVKLYHKTQIEFMQHERLIHLIVTLAFAFILLISYYLTAFYPQGFLFIISLILTVVELFYIVHYYRLENGVQRWYTLFNSICQRAQIN